MSKFCIKKQEGFYCSKERRSNGYEYYKNIYDISLFECQVLINLIFKINVCLETACSLGAFKKTENDEILHCGGLGYGYYDYRDEYRCRLIYGTPKKHGRYYVEDRTTFSCRYTYSYYTFWIPTYKDEFNAEEMKFKGQFQYTRDHSSYWEELKQLYLKYITNFYSEWLNIKSTFSDAFPELIVRWRACHIYCIWKV